MYLCETPIKLFDIIFVTPMYSLYVEQVVVVHAGEHTGNSNIFKYK